MYAPTEAHGLLVCRFHRELRLLKQLSSSLREKTNQTGKQLGLLKRDSSYKPEAVSLKSALSDIALVKNSKPVLSHAI